VDGHHVADADRHLEVQVVDEGRDRNATAMTLGRDGRADVDPAHDGAAEGRAQDVGVLGQDLFGHLGLALAGRERFGR